MPRVRNPVASFADGITAVSTATPLTGWKSLGGCDTVLAALLNLSNSVNVYLLVETSEDGSTVDGDVSWLARAAPGKQATVEITENSRSWFRVSAYSEPPTYSSANVRVALVGINLRG